MWDPSEDFSFNVSLRQHKSRMFLLLHVLHFRVGEGCFYKGSSKYTTVGEYVQYILEFKPWSWEGQEYV